MLRLTCRTRPRVAESFFFFSLSLSFCPDAAERRFVILRLQNTACVRAHGGVRGVGGVGSRLAQATHSRMHERTHARAMRCRGASTGAVLLSTFHAAPLRSCSALSLTRSRAVTTSALGGMDHVMLLLRCSKASCLVPDFTTRIYSQLCATFYVSIFSLQTFISKLPCFSGIRQVINYSG